MDPKGGEYDVTKAYHFLLNYQMIYNFPVTHFMLNKVWESLPDGWENVLVGLSEEELNQLPFGYIDVNWPTSFQQFLKSALQFSMPRTQDLTIKPTDLTFEEKKGMSHKKAHEVAYMSSIVHKIATQTGSDVIVDVGSGLGYLGQILSKKYNHHVIGLESKACHTSGAEKRTTQSGEMEHLTFELKQSDESMKQFDVLMQGVFEKCGNTISKSVSPMKQTNFQSSPNADEEYGEEISVTTRNPSSKNCDIDSHCDCVPKHSGDIQPNVNELNLREKHKKCHLCDKCSQSSCFGCLSNCDAKKSRDSCKCEFFDSMKHICNNCKAAISCAQQTETIQGMPCVHKVLMIGLHCCGDLTPTMMQYFQHFDNVSGLCCVSCCYHRMDCQDGSFHNFPMSNHLKAFDMTLSGDVPRLNIFAMRLAAQETRSRWRHQSKEDHSEHAKNVAFRAILQLYTTKYGDTNLEKKFRKLVHKADMTSFETYIHSVCSRSNLELDTCVLMQLYKDYEKFEKYIEPFTALQVILQPVLETLIFRDRQLWLQELGFHVDIVPLFDDNISPRNLALMAVK